MHDRRPAWRIGTRPDALPGLAIPRQNHVAGVTRSGEPVWFPPVRGGARSVLRHRLALALESDHQLAFERLQEHDRAELARLRAAALRDVLGLRYEEIADACGYADVRTARRAVPSGRKLWCGLGAWPWWQFRADEGRPPAAWRSTGGGPRLDAAFMTWATGELHLLGERWRAACHQASNRLSITESTPNRGKTAGKTYRP